MKYKELRKVLNDEIKWAKENEGTSESGKGFKAGYLLGMETALYFSLKLEDTERLSDN